MGFLSKSKLFKMGFAYVADDALISERAVFYGAERISIGSKTRIDDFCVISAGEGGVDIGRFIHIAVYCSLQGKGRIVMEDFSGLSSKCTVYSSSDDFSGKSLTNPCIPAEFRKFISGDVYLRKHVIVGTCSTIMPGVEIGLGSAIGAYSLVSKSIAPFSIAVGVPAKAVKRRKDDILFLEKEFLRSFK